jgi:hypothetical protein
MSWFDRCSIATITGLSAWDGKGTEGRTSVRIPRLKGSRGDEMASGGEMAVCSGLRHFIERRTRPESLDLALIPWHSLRASEQDLMETCDSTWGGKSRCEHQKDSRDIYCVRKTIDDSH